MFCNYLRSALGDLWRSPAQSIIAIGGLAIGLMVSIIAGIVTYDAFTRNHFVEGYDRLYLTIIEHRGAGGDRYLQSTPHDLAPYLRAFPGVEKVARTSPGGPAVIGRGDLLIREERLNWADPDFFRIYRVPALHGDLSRALDRPDSMVISRAMARKYFGQDNAVGQVLMLNHRPMTVRAVIEDWAFNAGSYNAGLYASSLSQASPMTADIGTQGMSRSGALKTDMTTWVRLAPDASLDDLNRRGTALISQFVPQNLPFRRAIVFERSDQLNMSRRINPDDRAHLYVMEAVALIILLLSCVNFINFSIARSSQRALEVGVRKAAGASRGALVVQFLSESVLQVLLALFVAIALVEWSLPSVNTFLESAARFDYWHNPALLAAMLGGAVLVGILAGAYPALVLSQFRPALVLKGWAAAGSKGALLRQILVGLQFAALTLFLVSAITVYRQNAYVTGDAMRVSTERMLFVVTPKCTDALRERMARLKGVEAAACSSLRVFPDQTSTARARPRDRGEQIGVFMVPVNFGFFELFGIEPVAGRLFAPGRGDEIADPPPTGQNAHYVINESAVRQLRFTSADAAIGQKLFHDPPPPAFKPGEAQDIYSLPGTIVGVVKDFSFTPEIFAAASSSAALPPMAFSVGNAEVNLGRSADLLHIRLAEADISGTLARIDAEWRRAGARDPIQRDFLADYVTRRDGTTRKIGHAFSVFAVIAMLLACLGLFGISLFMAMRRVKEIGVRKAMGASTPDIVRLLLWQFAKPVLWANAVALPLAWFMMDRWLSGFAYRVDLDWRIFAGATLITLLIALLTVAAQSIAAARAVPATALRYE